jgi:hypothetical protein
MPRPTAVAEPPLEPPEVRPAPHGLPVAPCRIESVTPFQANSGVVVLPIASAQGRPPAGEEHVLDRHRDAVRRAERSTFLPPAGRLPRGGDRGLLVDEHHRVDRGVVQRDRVERRAGGVDGGELSGPVALGELRRAHQAQVGHRGAPLLLGT